MTDHIEVLRKLQAAIFLPSNKALTELEAKQIRALDAAISALAAQGGGDYVATERNIYFGAWGTGKQECVDGDCVLRRTMPECMDCGHRFRWSTVNALTKGASSDEH